jgi:hypothetical protein
MIYQEVKHGNANLHKFIGIRGRAKPAILVQARPAYEYAIHPCYLRPPITELFLTRRANCSLS